MSTLTIQLPKSLKQPGLSPGDVQDFHFIIMFTPILDPSLAADHSPLVAGEMRGQFQAIQRRGSGWAPTLSRRAF